MPKSTEEQLLSEEWPPMIQVEDDQVVQMTELDVSWLLATTLKMKWHDVQAIEDNLERRFLYNKAMWIAQAMNDETAKLEEKKNMLEEKLDKKIEELTMQQDQIQAPEVFGQGAFDDGEEHQTGSTLSL